MTEQQEAEIRAKIAILEERIKRRDENIAREKGVWGEPMGEIVMFGNVSRNEEEIID